MEHDDLAKYPEYDVCCLCIDMIKSTETGLGLVTTQLDRFNRSLIEQIVPHIKGLSLEHAVMKFTGDGWLVMSHHPREVRALCCLAVVQAKRFREEMSQETGVSVDLIPELRLAVCRGRDIRITLPDGCEDFVGDSARRANRACSCCFPSEILIDEPTRYHISRDFKTAPANIDQRPPDKQPKHAEEELVLHVLGGLKSEAAFDSEAPECFVYTFEIVGKREEAATIAEQAGRRLQDEARKPGVSKQELQKITRRWNRLLASVPDYSHALDGLAKMRASGLAPDAVTYNTLIYKCGDYEKAKDLVAAMQKEGIQPNIVTYNTLIAQAPDYEKAKGLVAAMQKEGIQPNVVTYNTLIAQAPDYEKAKGLVAAMQEEGIPPNVVTYSSLIAQAPDYETAKGCLKAMQEEGIRLDVVAYSSLIAQAPDYETAKGCLKAMQKEGVQPDVVTYSTLIAQAPDYEKAKGLVAAMQKEGLRPNVVTYTYVFSKDISGISAGSILEWYLAQEYHPEEPIQTLIARYRKLRHIDQALRLALDYPHLQSARKVIREHKDEALLYFRGIADQDPRHPNAEYALGVAFLELGQEAEARSHLQRALKLASAGPRIAVIKEWIRQLDQNTS